MIDIGKNLELFYLSLESKDVIKILDALAELESFMEIETRTKDVNLEIINDARKKAASLVRSKYNSKVQQLITSCRKKLHARAVIKSKSKDKSNHDNQDDGNSHANRHIGALIELFGTWSDYILEIVNLGMSSQTLITIINPIHCRVTEMSIECYTQYRIDKNLQHWQDRFANAEHDGIPITALDQIIGQLATMRSVVCRYIYFLRNICNNDAFMKLESREMTGWRELDGYYIALEFHYLAFATKVAAQQQGIIEIQEGEVYAMQAVEDIFFVIQRVIDRAISSGEQGNIYAVCSRVVEILDPDVDLRDAEALSLYDILSNRSNFRGVIRRLKSGNTDGNNGISDNTTNSIKENGNNNNSSSSSKSNGHVFQGNGHLKHVTTNNDTTNSTTTNEQQGQISNTVTATSKTSNDTTVTLGSSSQFLNQLTDVSALSTTLVGMAGNLLEAVAPTEHVESMELRVDEPVVEFDTLLKNALDDFTDNLDEVSDKQKDITDILYVHRPLPGIIGDDQEAPVPYPRNILAIEDLCLQINTLCVPVSALSALMKQISVDELGPLTPHELVLQELSRLQNKYSSLLELNLKETLSAEFYGGLYSIQDGMTDFPLGSAAAIRLCIGGLGSRGAGYGWYEITGEEMERRSANNMLSVAMSSCVGEEPISWLSQKLRPLLSVTAYGQVLKCFGMLCSEEIVVQMQKLRFNEWGAMLLHQDVHAALQVLETAAAELDEGMSVALSKVRWALKIITLDAPADIKRYKVPVDVISQDCVKSLMTTRSDFSKDAVQNINLNSIQM